jgi:uncharacterized protein
VIELEPHTVVLLRARADRPELPDEELDRLQERHLSFLQSLYDRGLLLASGPLGDTDEESWRGICVYTVGHEEARRIASDDPSVWAGRLDPVAFTWMARAGAVSFGAAT